jgi:hypothetical protein
VSPQSRGRPTGRGRRRPTRRPGANRTAAKCWFDEPSPGDRRSWAVPPGHGSYRGLDLELLDPADEDELTFLIEAMHPELADALRRGGEMSVGGEPFSPRLHVAMHQIVANQLLAGDPPETWQTVQRLAALGYDWHNIMHMIAGVVSEDVYYMVREKRPFDPVGYIGRLNELPGDWPPP